MSKNTQKYPKIPKNGVLLSILFDRVLRHTNINQLYNFNQPNHPSELNSP